MCFGRRISRLYPLWGVSYAAAPCGADSSFDALEANEFPFLFIPEAEAQAFESFHEGEGFDVLEDLVRVVAGLEIIVRDARTEVVDVVVTDISGEPLEDFWKFVK